MNPSRGANTLGGRARPFGLLRLGLYTLIVVQKALLCLLLLEAAFEGGFMPEAAAEQIKELTETFNPTDRPDDRRHTPRPLFATHHLHTVGVPVKILHLNPSIYSPGQRAPPVC